MAGRSSSETLAHTRPDRSWVISFLALLRHRSQWMVIFRAQRESGPGVEIVRRNLYRGPI